MTTPVRGRKSSGRLYWLNNSSWTIKKDLAYLISDEGKRNLIDVIVGGLEAFYSLSFPFHEH